MNILETPVTDGVVCACFACFNANCPNNESAAGQVQALIQAYFATPEAQMLARQFYRGYAALTPVAGTGSLF